MISGIYSLVDPRTNRIRYIGLSVNLYYRKKQHLDKSNKRTKGPHLLNWLNQLYELNLQPTFTIIDKCSVEKLQERERYWIKYHKSIGADLVNISDGGEDFNCASSTRQKISASLMGHEVLPETREKLRLAAIEQHKTNPHTYTEEQKKALSEARKGMKFTEEHKKNIGLAQKGTKRPNKKGLVIVDNLGNEFISASKAAKFHNMTISTVCRLVSGQMKTSSTGLTFVRIINGTK